MQLTAIYEVIFAHLFEQCLNTFTGALLQIPPSMAITYKLFLDQRRVRQTDLYPLKVRVTLNRKHKEVPLNITLRPKDWNAVTQKISGSHPNAKLITVKINQTLNEIQEKALRFETIEKVYGVEDLAGAINDNRTTTFQSFADQEIANLINAGRVGNAITYRTATNRLVTFTGKSGLRFEQIDFKLLDRFSNFMQTEGMTLNAIASYMREIRAIYNKAIKAEVVEQKYYPFSKYKIKTTKTISRALTVKEMQAIVKLKLQPHTPMWHSRNYFLLSFCLIGTNFTDLFKLTPASIQNSRVAFSRSKTKKIYSICLHSKAIELLHCYFEHGSNPDYLLPVLSKGDSPTEVKKKALQAIKTTNKYLEDIATACKIKQDVTTYYARYSWANIAKSLGYSKDVIAEALGHEYGNRVTGIYLDNYDNKIIDAANAKVIAAVFGK